MQSISESDSMPYKNKSQRQMIPYKYGTSTLGMSGICRDEENLDIC